ncbi:hypothetical protein, partial [Hyphomonas sp.]|uniref:hypothetical protein n=1 Tax=Hyphomonas sp. TaxID=87 RepID=UPI00329930BE
SHASANRVLRKRESLGEGPAVGSLTVMHNAANVCKERILTNAAHEKRAAFTQIRPAGANRNLDFVLGHLSPKHASYGQRRDWSKQVHS